ncbi:MULTISPECIES: AGE family epimerase/isomerase [unclassified Cyanobium]|uniref:AGE family epimerase/isomerase n=1 Tax=unclassified Cyanobium TaxID=2627006 RepID=UPI0020CC1B19|nr:MULTISPECIES: AGE family epimerase/isomerase [unclassified Cyanobium]MCP9859344.1 AGE family epimerase/isomerase [Cyanobium sp. Cruz-8H5]MCP9866545.1 AGE family epimerase/isomerase [Cyanobium sp. Cruz-8D1]
MTAPAAAWRDPVARLEAALPALARNLNEAVLPFWYPHVLDQRHGGYTVALAAAGRPGPQPTKSLVTQARLLWLFARLAYSEQPAAAMREAAEHGYRFLVDRFQDPVHGGYVWTVDASGRCVVDGTKVIYGQAFALFALSGYVRATGDPEALAHAGELFDHIDRHGHDAVYGGYHELFGVDWSAPAARRTSPIGGPAGAKLTNTHLHLLEALAEYVRASGSLRARQRLLELITILGNTVVRQELGACTDQHQRDWTPILRGGGALVSYGHDLETIWLLADAIETAGRSNATWLDVYGRLFDYSYRHGWDGARGGFFYSGGFHRKAQDRRKVWWVQAEALMSSLTLFRLTRETRYVQVFEQTLQWVMEQQTDWTEGEWHAEVHPDGSVNGAKADQWKEAYHNGRALIFSIEIINSLRNALSNDGQARSEQDQR